MRINGNYTFNAAPERVWDVLMDTTVIASCLPGCRELRDLGGDRYQADLVIPVAAITGEYAATVAIENKVAPRSYRLVIEGTGRPGFVKGQADIALEEASGQTIVRVDGSADVGGAVARVGQRLLEGVARMTMDRFFGCLQKAVGDRGQGTGDR